MLVLTRRKNESVIIGGQIIVTVLELRGGQIRLGITAPRGVQVTREELTGDAESAVPLQEQRQRVE